MKALLLTLQGPLRAWGMQSLGDNRNTETHPSASALIGLLGACAGIDRHDDESTMAWYNAWDCVSLTAHSYTCDLPERMTDFQTAHDSLSTAGKSIVNPVVSHRGYLQETIDVALLIARPGAPEHFFECARAGLENPVYTPYLGRICNPLSALPWLPHRDPVISGDSESLIDAAINAIRDGRRLLPWKDNARPLALNAQLIVPSGWLSSETRNGRRLRYRSSFPDERGLAGLSYARRPVDVFSVNLGIST